MSEHGLYRPLDSTRQEVRLLDILPFSKRPEDAVACTLRVVALQDEPTPRYQTISYVWGDPTPCCSIILNGKIFMVPRSTDQVLRRVSDRENVRTVWIDAVCINQADLQERAQQVTLMDQVYFFTTGGIVYLGQGEQGSAQAIANLEDLAREVKEIAKTPYEEGMLFRPRGSFAIAPDTSRLHVNLDVDALTKFLALPWLRRVWVIQEAVLPAQSECLLGDSKISIDTVLTGCAWLMYHRTHLPSALRNNLGLLATQSMWSSKCVRDSVIATLDDRRNIMSSGEPLGILVLNIRGSSTSDERDRVFGLLGLAAKKRPLPELIRPDYTKSLAEVMRDATRYFISVEALLGFFVVPCISHRRREDVTDPDWPSWVPRIHRTDQSRDPAALPAYSMNTTSEAVISCDANVLRLKGYEVGVVGFTSDILFESGLGATNTQQALSSIHKFVDITNSSNTALRRTLLADVNFALERCSEASYADYDTLLAYLFQSQTQAFNPQDISLSSLGEVDANSQDAGMRISRFLIAMARACKDRKFARTWRGHYALVPKVCEPRDVIVMIPGCRTPVVLGQLWSEDDEERQLGFVMLGECYLDGHMWPEDIERVKNSDRKLYHWNIL
ncbi:hypothetical protein CB0940_08553 [Cercospora beticola]|uniref:Heterokaryon incompatibility domain-containing protein n=1 Tax=Cercospora beticola TaxID=122368 RepID=A0A2G5HQD0_CERBT|nr:hypothetical protein CB0940_08553 [Cercospora beticola]PIA94483.1 hypothetical protein CB0940_08553 [Cercospora beticola]WPB05130.1 hypothetical protein RHO25_009780 [Cercospora beticola]